ncbi:MAG: Hsp20/alpha crystallin family protein [Deltaproteobacteria bacterium]|nr:Hsp20/alpha crystallin family protein [Deltaproteobacteria bacterium]
MAKNHKKTPDTGCGKTIDTRGVVKFLVDELGSLGQKADDETTSSGISVDLYMKGDIVVLEAELPGVKYEDVTLEYFKGSVTIRASKYECFDEEEVTYVCMERSFGKLARKIDIPLPVNSAKFLATFNRGILKVEMPRIEEKRGLPKQIPIEPEKK